MNTTKTDENEIVFHGIVVKRSEEFISVRLFPGLIIDIKVKDIAEIEEATDESTQRAYVRIRLNKDASYTSSVQPRLMRLAAAAEGVPFSLGGVFAGNVREELIPGVQQPSLPGDIPPDIPPGTGGPTSEVRMRTDAIGVRSTRSWHIIFGWTVDDREPYYRITWDPVKSFPPSAYAL